LIRVVPQQRRQKIAGAFTWVGGGDGEGEGIAVENRHSF
jgi:hypothetical protein